MRIVSKMNWIIDAKAFEYDRHYSECKKNNQPFIKARINLETKRYLIFLDMAGCDYRISKTGLKKLQSFFEKNPDTHVTLDREYCTFDGVSEGALNQFLVFLYDITQEYNEPK